MDVEMLKYQQQLANKEVDEKKDTVNPYQKEENFFEENLSLFKFENLKDVLKDLGKDTIFTLKDGTQVHIVKTERTVLLTVGQKGKSKFSGSWTIINNYEEYGQELGELENLIEQR